MLTELELRIERLRAALSDATLAEVPPFRWDQLSETNYRIDFSQTRSPAQIANLAAALIANVACLKDHLKAWCERTGHHFEGDSLIDSDRDVALIHDLWNRDKHFKLDRPRSGTKPILSNLTQEVEIASLDGTAGSSIEGLIDSHTGEVRMKAGPNSRISLVVDGEIIDESGAPLGKLSEVCARAIASWTRVLRAAGVPV